MSDVRVSEWNSTTSTISSRQRMLKPQPSMVNGHRVDGLGSSCNRNYIQRPVSQVDSPVFRLGSGVYQVTHPPGEPRLPATYLPRMVASDTAVGPVSGCRNNLPGGGCSFALPHQDAVYCPPEDSVRENSSHLSGYIAKREEEAATDIYYMDDMWRASLSILHHAQKEYLASIHQLIGPCLRMVDLGVNRHENLLCVNPARVKARNININLLEEIMQLLHWEADDHTYPWVFWRLVDGKKEAINVSPACINHLPGWLR